MRRRVRCVFVLFLAIPFTFHLLEELTGALYLYLDASRKPEASKLGDCARLLSFLRKAEGSKEERRVE